ncbi:type II toxin-antitoxin system RelE/ParE family toxin [Burkholderia cenocepacia]|uniref:type II toxin-antitoxin system RelE/ParE family toxin n=1 Tax=Burkholderia pseudomultivorans TaxID=1207504 RepID=UPI001E47B4E9|nr:type II toxin-antitoxin system RelE/ParE family toxin [Burkholderia pseudomultivorans]
MIQSFKCKDTRQLFETGRCRRFANIADVAMRRLTQLDNAATLDAMKSPPGNRFEPLKGDRVSQYSVRINDQWRLCFTWGKEGPADVEIADYH